MGAVDLVVDTGSFNRTGQITITNQGYASAAHEDLSMPAIAAEGTGGNGKAIDAVRRCSRQWRPGRRQEGRLP